MNKSQQAYSARIKKKAEGKTLTDSTHVWMKRWPCLILDGGDPNKRMCRILYFLESGGTAQSFALPIEMETLAEALERKRAATTTNLPL